MQGRCLLAGQWSCLRDLLPCNSAIAVDQDPAPETAHGCINVHGISVAGKVGRGLHRVSDTHTYERCLMAHACFSLLFGLFVFFTTILWTKPRFTDARPTKLRQSPHQHVQAKMELPSFGSFVGQCVAEIILAQTVSII